MLSVAITVQAGRPDEIAVGSPAHHPGLCTSDQISSVTWGLWSHVASAPAGCGPTPAFKKFLTAEVGQILAKPVDKLQFINVAGFAPMPTCSTLHMLPKLSSSSTW